MALQSLEQQSLDRFGDSLAGKIGIDTEMLDDMYTRAYRTVVNRVNMYAPDKLGQFASQTTVADASGKTITALGGGHITSVLRRYNTKSRDYPCRPVIPEHFALADWNESGHKAYYVDPCFSIIDGTLHIKPDPTATDLGKIRSVQYPATIDASVETLISGVTGVKYPIELEEAGQLYVQLMLKWRATEYYRKLAIDAVQQVTGAVSSSSEVFTDETTVVVTHNAGIYPLVLILDTNNKIMAGSVTHDDTDGFTVTFPVAKSGTIVYTVSDGSGLLTSFTTALPTWTAGNISDATYATAIPTAGNLAGLTNSIPTYAAIDLTGITLPGAVGDPTTSPPSAGSMTSTLNGISAGNITRIQKILSLAGDLIYKGDSDDDTVFPSGSEDLSFRISDDDSEMGNLAVQGIMAINDTAAKEIQAAVAALGIAGPEASYEVGVYSGAVGAYKAKIDGLLGEFNADLQRYVQGIKTALEEYATEHKLNLEIFMGEFQTVVAQYKAEYEQDMIEWKSGLDRVLALHQASLDEELKTFQAGLAKAESYLKAAQLHISSANTINGSVQYINYEIQELEKEFDAEVRSYCGVQFSDQQAPLPNDRRR